MLRYAQHTDFKAPAFGGVNNIATDYTDVHG